MTHGLEKITVKVKDDFNNLENQINKEDLIVAIDFKKVVGIKLIEYFSDSDSSMSQRDTNYKIKGRVFQMIEIENDFLIDVYIQNYADFVSFLKSEIQDIELQLEEGVELLLEDLVFQL